MFLRICESFRLIGHDGPSVRWCLVGRTRNVSLARASGLQNAHRASKSRFGLTKHAPRALLVTELVTVASNARQAYAATEPMILGLLSDVQTSPSVSHESQDFRV